MMEVEFRKYDHLERLGHPEVRDIDIGSLFVFPKLDGTNASVWLDDEGSVQCGSRNRVLSIESDNAGFCAWVNSNDERAKAVRDYVIHHPARILYGEWLVPHSLKTYRGEAWRRFWVFDVFDRERDRYLSWTDYNDALRDAGVDLVIPLATADNPSGSQLQAMSDRNTFLVEDGKGCGEGIVIKNYDWQNHLGKQPWAKIVRSEFKEANSIEFGPAHVKGERDICAEIIAELATEGWVRKEFDRVVRLVANEKDVHLDTLVGSTDPFTPYDEFVALNRGKIIPRTLGTLFYVFVKEEVGTIVRKWKNPVVDFGRLHKLLTIRIKQVLTEVF